jgi:hypothetical protein
MMNQVHELAQYLLAERVGLVVIEATGDCADAWSRPKTSAISRT